jgi:hypothetical protein
MRSWVNRCRGIGIACLIVWGVVPVEGSGRDGKVEGEEG